MNHLEHAPGRQPGEHIHLPRQQSAGVEQVDPIESGGRSRSADDPFHETGVDGRTDLEAGSLESPVDDGTTANGGAGRGDAADPAGTTVTGDV